MGGVGGTRAVRRHVFHVFHQRRHVFHVFHQGVMCFTKGVMCFTKGVMCFTISLFLASIVVSLLYRAVCMRCGRQQSKLSENTWIAGLLGLIGHEVGGHDARRRRRQMMADIRRLLGHASRLLHHGLATVA